MKYETLNHAKLKLRYHIIFSTKYRQKLLNQIQDDLFQCFKNIENKYKTFKIEIMNIDKDHIHFLLNIKPSESISNVVKLLKQHSTYLMYKQHYEYLRKFYWKQHHLWTRGYFCCTIGNCKEENLKKYIENQQNKKKTKIL